MLDGLPNARLLEACLLWAEALAPSCGRSLVLYLLKPPLQQRNLAIQGPFLGASSSSSGAEQQWFIPGTFGTGAITGHLTATTLRSTSQQISAGPPSHIGSSVNVICLGHLSVDRSRRLHLDTRGLALVYILPTAVHVMLLTHSSPKRLLYTVDRIAIKYRIRMATMDRY